MTIFISEVASWCYWYQLCHYWHLNFYLKNIDVAWPLFSIFCHVLFSEMILENLDTRGLGCFSHFFKSSLKYIQYKAENVGSLQNSITAALISSNNRTNYLEGLWRGTHTAKVISSSFFPARFRCCCYPSCSGLILSTPRITIAPLIPFSLITQMEMLLWMVLWSLSN